MSRKKKIITTEYLDYKAIAKRIAANTYYPKKDTEVIAKGFVEECIKAVKEGYGLRLTGLGIMEVEDRPATRGYNFYTGENIVTEPYNRLIFRVSERLKDAIRNKDTSK